jgi:hypothetical protein
MHPTSGRYDRLPPGLLCVKVRYRSNRLECRLGRASLRAPGGTSTEAAVTAFQAHSETERAPIWLWGLSWTFWLAMAGAALSLGVHKIKTHEEQLVLGRATWRLEYEICKRISAAPRPSWRECLTRMDDLGANLLAPATTGL